MCATLAASTSKPVTSKPWLANSTASGQADVAQADDADACFTAADAIEDEGPG